jgi:micrococcal nuclease
VNRERRLVWPPSLGWRLLASLTLALIQWPTTGSAQATDCTGYDSQIWAQSVFETDPTRYALLDPDGDGLACEELPPGAAPAWWTDEIPAGAEPATLVDVSDGDTIRVSLNGQTSPVRLILIDTPETHDPDDPPECYGQEATAYLSWLLSLGGQLYLETDVTDRDRYDRLLRYAWLDFGDGHAYLVNEVMVRSGYAALYTYPPDVKYVEQIREAQTFARGHGYGLWSGCITDAQGDTNELSGTDTPPALSAQEQANATCTTTVDETGHIVEPQGCARPIIPEPVSGQVVVPDPVDALGCDASYPDVCIPPSPPDLDCGDIGARRFTVLPPDPHNFDGDADGVGCESGWLRRACRRCRRARW